MNKIINIGVLSTANIAVRSVIPAIKSLKNKFTLGAIASRSEEKLFEIPKEFDVKKNIGYELIINDPEIDAVYIPLPNSLHQEWIKKALLRGKHVLVEKSLGCNYKEVLELNHLAKERKLVLLENFLLRPRWLHMKVI